MTASPLLLPGDAVETEPYRSSVGRRTKVTWRTAAGTSEPSVTEVKAMRSRWWVLGGVIGAVVVGLLWWLRHIN